MIHPSERKIWWFTSYPKSGNTWLRMFINAYVSGFKLDINSAFQFAFNDLTSQIVQITCARPIDKLTFEEQAYYRPATLLNFLNLYATRDIALKTHHAKIAVNDIPVCPNQLSRGAVYIIRDPRDVAVSFADHLGEPMDDVIGHMGNVKFALKNKDNLHHVLLTWSKHVKSWTKMNTNIETIAIKYEDLLEDPHKHFAKILQFLTMPVFKEKLDFAVEETKFENLRAREDEKGFVEVSDNSKSGKFFRVGKAGQWKEVLTEAQVAKIEEDHGDMMEEYGYELVTKQTALVT